jgi:glycosyltransferase involved in cell wall biosynthesis
MTVRSIGLVSSEFPPHPGGMENYAYFLAEELVNRGYDVHLFVPPGSDGIAGARSHPLLTRNILVDIWRLRRYQMDAWHVNNSGYSTLAMFKDNVIAHIHGNDFLNPWIGVDGKVIWRLHPYVNKYLMAAGFRKARNILSNSRHTRSLFLKKFGVTDSLEAKTEVFHVGLPKECYLYRMQEDAALRTDPVHRFVTVSRLFNSRKNVDSVIEGVADIIQKDGYPVRYTVIGDGREKESLVQLAKRLGVSDMVKFTGSIDRESLNTYLLRSDLFILAPRNTEKDVEGFGIVYLEANGCGIPVLASRNSGTEDAVQEGVSGFFVEEPTREGIRAALLRFLRKEIVLERSNAFRHAENFSWTKFVDRLESTIYSNISGNG